MGIETHTSTPLGEAIRRAGGQSAFGRIVNRNQSTIFDWLRLGKPLPAELVLTVEREIGVSKHLLRPDIYPLDTTVTGPLSLSHDGGDVANGAPMVAFNRSAVLPHVGAAAPDTAKGLEA